MSPSYTDKHRPGPGSGEQGKQARSPLAGFLGGLRRVLERPETSDSSPGSLRRWFARTLEAGLPLPGPWGSLSKRNAF